MRVALYTRLSPNPDKKDTVNQETDLTEFANRQGWEITEIYTDIDTSGGKKGEDRKAFRKMMDAASKKKFDLLLFWSLDRLSREGAWTTADYIRKLDSYGVDFRSYTQPFLDSCGVFKEVIIDIMATLAKQERINIRERTVAGLRTARAKGVKLGRAYATRITKKRKIAFDLIEARKMQDAGASYAEIAGRFKVGMATAWRYLKDDRSSMHV
jgi:DNA invertase Pin-like site-specific DNA recombinase